MTTQRKGWLERLLGDEPTPDIDAAAGLLAIARLGAAVDYIDNALRSIGTAAMREAHIRDLLLDVRNILTNDEATP